ncbi:MAG: hypothetical protein AAGA95_14165 [Pseudomonadota bacterium]
MASVTDARVFLIMMGARKVGSALYAWGGETEVEGGYDCSGFVSHILTETNRAWPGLYTGGRLTARDLYRHFDKLECPDITKVEQLKPGCIVVYHDRDKSPARSATHVALHVTNVPDMHIAHGNSVFTADVGPVAFEAGGAGSSATSPRSALKKSATIRVTATDTHAGKTWVAKDPFFHLERILSGEIEVDLPAATGGENVIEKLFRDTMIERSDLRRAQTKVRLPAATRYNRTQETEGVWQHEDLPPPLPEYPSDSAEFAILVAHKQREFGFSRSKVDGMLGDETLEKISS